MKFAEINPTDDELRLTLEIGFLLRELGKFEEAAQIFRGASKLIPESDVPLVGLGTVEFQQRNFEAAHEAYEQALKIKPDSLYAKVHRAETRLFEGKRDQAENELREIIAANPESPHSRTAQALIDLADSISPNLK
ncbi:MAG: tetratricopeptide repeat protein [Pyrinomonadaceae bacterium]|nr:tetratricopeptide repeat protein [Pyrinomonadaceae bacterium]